MSEGHVQASASGHVSLAGEFDLSNASKIDEVLRPLDGKVIVDCAELQFIDSTGIKVLALNWSRLCEEGGSLRLENVDPFIARVLELVGLSALVAGTT